MRLRSLLVSLTVAGLVACAGSAHAATIVRSVSNTTQLKQLFTDAEANPSDTYQGNLSPNTYALTETLRLSKGRVVLQGGSILSHALSYVFDCQGGCSANGSTGQVFRVVRAAGFGGTPYLKFTGITVRGGYSTEFSLRGGGGALVEGGTLEITNSLILRNKANQWGAGLLAKDGANLYLTNSVVRENENDQIFNCGNGNTAFAGGIGVLNATAVITNSSILWNLACKGAGIAVWGQTGQSASLSLYNSTVSGNRANYHGGGVLLWGATKYAHISFSTIAHNVAGVANDGGDAKYGGGIGFRDVTIASGGQAPPIRIWGTILAKNSLQSSSSAIGQDCYSTTTLAASNIGVASNFVGKNGNCGNFLNWTSTTGGSTFIGTEASPLDPLINASLTGGNSTPLAHAPLFNSPLTSEYTGGNRSRNLVAMSCPGVDTAGQNRGSGPIFPTHCDIGAYETSTCFTTTFTPLTLTQGWTPSPWGAAPATAVDCEGQLLFKGAIQTSGQDAVAAYLSSRPSTWTYVPTGLFEGTKGRFNIDPSTGAMSVQAETSFSNAQNFTSLDGPSFALDDATGFQPVTLLNGWSNAPYSTRNAAYSSAGGMVRLRGAIATTGSNMIAFTLPPGARPSAVVYVHADLASAAKGRLVITPNGDVTVQAYNNNTAAAKAFTSLEGVWFSISGTGYSQLTLLNGWWHAPFSTRNAAYSVERGMVRLSGAVATTSGNTNNVIFTLPAGARPSSTAWIPVNLCAAAGGRLNIFPDGTVKVQAERQLSDATCFTSLEGVRFGL